MLFRALHGRPWKLKGVSSSQNLWRAKETVFSLILQKYTPRPDCVVDHRAAAASATLKPLLLLLTQNHAAFVPVFIIYLRTYLFMVSEIDSLYSCCVSKQQPQGL